MKVLNYDMFGGVSRPPVEEKSRKFKTMQELHGITKNRTCKECKHLIKRVYSNTYYKCGLWKMSNSVATDIRLKNQACGKFESAK